MTDRKPAEDNTDRPWFLNWANQAPPAWSAFRDFAGATEPIARSATRANLEVSSLLGKRAQAYMAIPATLSRCRSPFDIFEAQMAFWQAAGRQYADTTRHLMEAWQSALPQVGAGSGEDVVRPRDYITFPEPKPEPADERRPSGTRRAA